MRVWLGSMACFGAVWLSACDSGRDASDDAGELAIDAGSSGEDAGDDADAGREIDAGGEVDAGGLTSVACSALPASLERGSSSHDPYLLPLMICGTPGASCEVLTSSGSACAEDVEIEVGEQIVTGLGELRVWTSGWTITSSTAG